MRATIVFAAWFCSVALLAGLNSEQAIARVENFPLTPGVAVHSTADETMDLALQEAILLFPREVGFVGWYASNKGNKAQLVLSRIGYRADWHETVYFFDGHLGDDSDRKEFFRLSFRDTMVLENFPPELALSSENEQTVVLKYPYEPGTTWTQLITVAKILVGTIVSNELDPVDHLRTVRVNYQMMSRSKDNVYYTAERIYKYGLGMVRMERWDGTGKASMLIKLVKTKPTYQFAAADHGKSCCIDLDSLKFITEPNGQQIADVWIKCEIDNMARARMIDVRRGQQESVEGFERLAYVKQHVWFNLADPAYRNPSSLPLRMIAQEVYYDTYGEVLHSTVPLTTWRGGKWFTIPGFEEIVQKIMAARVRK